MAQEDKDKKQEKKIIVDEDWKQQAQREKEELAEKEKQQKSQQSQQSGQSSRGELPKGDFSALVSMLVTQAFYAMGLINPEGQEKRDPDLELARYHIDMLETLDEKTKNNLSKQEGDVLESTLNQVRMAYVQLSGQGPKPENSQQSDSEK